MILIVDDDPHTCLMLQTLFELDGHVCQSAMQEAEVLRLVTYHRPRLVFMDLMMPHRSGFLVAEDVKHLRPSTTIIAMTAGSQERIAEARDWPHFVNVLAKPFDIEDICRIAAYYDEPEQEAA